VPRHVWGGPEMITPEGIPIYYKDPNEPKPCPPQPDQKKRSWLKRNPAQAMTFFNLIFLLLIFFWVNTLSREGPVKLESGWTLRAEFFDDDETGILSLRFESDQPKRMAVEILVGQNQRSIQTISLILEESSPQIFRFRLNFKPTQQALDLWIFNKKIKVFKG